MLVIYFTDHFDSNLDFSTSSYFMNSVIIIFWKDYQQVLKDFKRYFFDISSRLFLHNSSSGLQDVLSSLFWLFLGIWIFSTEFLFSLKTIEEENNRIPAIPSRKSLTWFSVFEGCIHTGIQKILMMNQPK